MSSCGILGMFFFFFLKITQCAAAFGDGACLNKQYPPLAMMGPF